MTKITVVYYILWIQSKNSTVLWRQFARVDAKWLTAVAGEADSVSSVSTSACLIGGPFGVNPGELVVYGREKLELLISLTKRIAQSQIFNSAPTRIHTTHTGSSINGCYPSVCVLRLMLCTKCNYEQLKHFSKKTHYVVLVGTLCTALVFFNPIARPLQK